MVNRNTFIYKNIAQILYEFSTKIMLMNDNDTIITTWS